MDWQKKKVFCFTGKLELLTRNEARSYVQRAGYSWTTDVTREVDYIVMADPNSTSIKARKARALGIKILSEEEFIDMLSVTKKQIAEKKAEDVAKKAKAPTTWKKCFKCVLKNLGLKSHESWHDYNYEKMTKSNFRVIVYFELNADLPETVARRKEVILAESDFVYGEGRNWYGKVTLGWKREETDDPEVAYERVLQRLLNPRKEIDVSSSFSEESHIERAISHIKNWMDPRSKQEIPNIPIIEFSSPDELYLILASYGWNVEIDD